MMIYPRAPFSPNILAAIGITARPELSGNTGHEKGEDQDQHKARRHSGDGGDPAAPQLFLPLFFGDPPLDFGDPFFVTPHL